MIIRDAVEADLPDIIEIYNATVPTRMVTAELEPTTVEARLPWFERLGFERWGFLPGIAQLDGVQRDLVVVGLHCRVSAEVTRHLEAPHARDYNESLSLMHTLMQYRHERIHSDLMKIRDKYSMLHLDVLILIYHFAKICSGTIRE